jgi:hypothetical protein
MQFGLGKNYWQKQRLASGCGSELDNKPCAVAQRYSFNMQSSLIEVEY